MPFYTPAFEVREREYKDKKQARRKLGGNTAPSPLSKSVVKLPSWTALISYNGYRAGEHKRHFTNQLNKIHNHQIAYSNSQASDFTFLY